MKSKLTYVLWSALLSFSITSFSQSSDPALVLHYNFEEILPGATVSDSSGYGNNGWQFNSTNLITATNGVFGSTAGRFTYVGFLTNDFPHIYQFSQYIAVTNLNGFEYLTNGTISLWARFDSNQDRGIYLLDSGYDNTYASNPSAASNSWTLGRLNSGHLSFFAYPASGGIRTIVNWPEDTVRPGGFNIDLSTTNIHLYTVSFDCVNDRAIGYYDGIPITTNTVGLPWLRIYGCSSQRWLCIGASSHDGTPAWGDDNYPNAGFFTGQLDDLRIYNRSLSSSEIRALYLGVGSPALPKNLLIRTTAPQSLQISWEGRSNTIYQVKWRSDLAAGGWIPLGAPIAGNGATNSIADSMIGQMKRFYRVDPMP